MFGESLVDQNMKDNEIVGTTGVLTGSSIMIYG